MVSDGLLIARTGASLLERSLIDNQKTAYVPFLVSIFIVNDFLAKIAYTGAITKP